MRRCLDSYVRKDKTQRRERLSAIPMSSHVSAIEQTVAKDGRSCHLDYEYPRPAGLMSDSCHLADRIGKGAAECT